MKISLKCGDNTAIHPFKQPMSLKCLFPAGNFKKAQGKRGDYGHPFYYNG